MNIKSLVKSIRITAIAVFCSIICTVMASAGSLTVAVSDTKGNVLENAVVMLKPLFDMPSGMLEEKQAEMRQQGSLFVPFVLPVTLGTKVSFPNLDEFRHHVYSFSKAKRFELRLYGKDETNSIVFDTAGVVALGCNIHDNMLAYIYVSEAPLHEKTGADGSVTFNNLMPGEYEMTAWHPGAKSKGAPAARKIVITDGVLQEATSIDLRRVWGIQSPPAEGQY